MKKLQVIIRRSLSKRWFSDLLFISLLVWMVFYYNLDSIIAKPPQGLHIWRQTDCLSITTNYYNGNAGFFKPEIHNLISDNNSSGKTAGEFPLLYWVIAMVWKITGKNEALYRIIGLLISFAGLYSVFRLVYRYSGKIIIALFAALLPFTSPVFVYYSVSFLPNTVAVSLAFSGWALFYTYSRSHKYHYLLLSVLLFTLSMLLKASAGISFLALTGWIVLELLFKRKIIPVSGSPFRSLLTVTAGAAFVLGWYIYAGRYNSIHGGKYTFNSIWPIWELSFTEIKDRLEVARILWKNQVLDHRLLWLSVAQWPLLLIFSRKLSQFNRYLLVALPAGAILYLLLWFQGLRDHDYYYIDLLPVILLFWISTFILASRYLSKYWSVLSMVPIILLALGAITCRKSIEERYTGWMNEWYTSKLEAVYETGSMLETLDIIPAGEIIISIPDQSINSTLYMLNRKGFTDFGSDFSKPGQIEDRIKKGARYLVINDSTLLGDSLVIPYLGKPLFNHRNVSIYGLEEQEKLY